MRGLESGNGEVSRVEQSMRRFDEMNRGTAVIIHTVPSDRLPDGVRSDGRHVYVCVASNGDNPTVIAVPNEEYRLLDISVRYGLSRRRAAYYLRKSPNTIRNQSDSLFQRFGADTIYGQIGLITKLWQLGAIEFVQSPQDDPMKTSE